MSQPNILLIYTDQQRYDTLGINGNAQIKTPCIDAWGAGGVHFSRGYVNSPICLPSRVSLHTGRYARATTSCLNGEPLLPREQDLPTHLRQHGYTTALIGKDHCFGPLAERAFDLVYGAGHKSMDEDENEDDRLIRESRLTAMPQPFVADPVPGNKSITARLCERAEGYIADDHDQPWFVWLSIPDPHPPYMVGAPYDTMYDEITPPPPSWSEREMTDKPHRQQLVVEWDRYTTQYPGDAIDQLRRIYWGQVSCIDTYVGKLLDRLETLGLSDDTIVIYTSDHGDYMGDHRMIRKGPHLYDALVHVPLIIRWGDHFPARSTDAFSSNIDLYPTLCELAGIPVPPQVQGTSLAPVLRGDAYSVRSLVFFEHGAPGAPLQPGDLTPEEDAALRDSPFHHLCPEICRGRSRAIRSDRYKYIFTPGDIDELYDLYEDPGELTNLAHQPEHSETVAEHREYLLRWTIATEDTLRAC